MKNEPLHTRSGKYLRRVLAMVFLFSVGLESRSATITVNTDVQYQKIEGFGASIVGWSSLMIPLYYEPDFVDFVVDELGLTLFRMQVWPMNYLTPQENPEDITYEDFVWTGQGNRGQVNNDFAIALRARNPEIRIIGSIWSPPPWMKENGSLTGTRSGFLLDSNRIYDQDNRLKDDHYQHYAKYLVEYQKYLQLKGIGLYAFGAQNEPMFTQSFESNLVSGEEYARLVRTLGKTYEAEGVPKPLFYGPEDMTLASYNPDGTTMDETRHNSYVENLMAEGTAEYFDVWATHGYTDGVNAGSAMDPERYWERIKQFDRPYWITEGGTGGHNWPDPVVNGVAAHIHHALTGGHVSAFVCWQITGSNADSHSIMHMRNPTKKTYAAMHFWKFIRPGAVRISAEPADDGLRVSAYDDPYNHQRVIVILNPGESEELVLQVEGTPSVDAFDLYKTNSLYKCSLVDTLEVVDGSLTQTMTQNSIVTLVGMHAGWEWDNLLGPLWQAGDDWRWHDTFGWLYVAQKPLVYSDSLGWIYLADGDHVHGLDFYDFKTGWSYTSKAYSPWVFNYASGTWVKGH